MNALRRWDCGCWISDALTLSYCAAHAGAAQATTTEEARIPICGTCGGVPPASGLPCVCGGANTISAERDGLRNELFDALQQCTAQTAQTAFAWAEKDRAHANFVAADDERALLRAQLASEVAQMRVLREALEKLTSVATEAHVNATTPDWNMPDWNTIERLGRAIDNARAALTGAPREPQ